MKQLNKKGIATSLIVDFWALVLFFVMFIIIYVAIIFTGTSDYSICVEKIKEDGTMHLLNILRTPIELEDRTITVQELISEYDGEEDEFKEELAKHLSPRLIDSFYCWSIKHPEDSILISSKTLPGMGTCEVGGAMLFGIGGSVPVSEVKFPLKDGRVVETSLYYWLKKSGRECVVG